MGKNIYVLGICSLITIGSFIVSIFISIRTKKIDDKIKELKAGKEYNKNRKKMASSLTTYQDAINQDKSYDKIRLNILNDLNVFYHVSLNTLSKKERSTFNKLIKEVEKDKNYDIHTICNLLSRIIGYLNYNKEAL